MWRPSVGNKLLRVWLLILALFEVPELIAIVASPAGAAATGGLKCNLSSAAGAHRVWALMITLLALARLLFLAVPHSPGVAWHCAAVHLAEAVVLGGEWAFFGCVPPDSFGQLVVAIVFANGALFVAVAATHPGSGRKEMIAEIARLKAERGAVVEQKPKAA